VVGPSPSLREGGVMSELKSPFDARCIGFGEFEDACENEAGDSPWSKLWCLRCDRLRLAHITDRMESNTKSLSATLEEEI
jgi:hypothetical protein